VPFWGGNCDGTAHELLLGHAGTAGRLSELRHARTVGCVSELRHARTVGCVSELRHARTVGCVSELRYAGTPAPCRATGLVASRSPPW
jgi:hypothetical protein